MYKMKMEPESTGDTEEFVLGWKNPKKQLPKIFNEMLQQKKFIDVTLSAEGHLFGAHRLILSAFSPYFCQLLAQIPIDQKAYVVLANVSASILKDLITFIYCGEVNVRRVNLGELLETGRLLNINGLADVKHSIESKSKSDKSSQLNSQIIIENNDRMKIQTTSADVIQEQEPMASASGYSDDSKPNAFEINNNSIYDDIDNEIPEKCVQNMARLDGKHLPSKRMLTVIHDRRFVSHSMPPKKIAKFKNDTSPSSYTIEADIRTNEFGRDNLFYKGFRFYQQVKGSKHIRWLCNKNSLKRCHAAMSTMVINNVTMMRILNAEHSHDA